MALAVTGTWRDTSRQKLYEELGWETFYQRRWYRRLTHFFCLRRSKSPEYLFNEIPQERQLAYNLRNPRAYEQPVARTVRFSNTYFRDTHGIHLTARSRILLQSHNLKRNWSQSFDQLKILHIAYLTSQV